jgi:group I intron endonuclease
MKNLLSNLNKYKSGIYVIENKVNKKKYVGKTKNFRVRLSQHQSAIKENSTRKINDHLRNAIKKYGKENFTFKVLEVCKLKDCSKRELYWIKKLDSTNRDKGYNIRLDSSTGMICSEETSKKISRRLKKEWKNGVRKEHSDKLKKFWKCKQKRKEQSKLFSKTLTKYIYFLESEEITDFLTYKDMSNLGYKNVLHKFKVHQTDRVFFKGAFIRRIKIEDIVSSSMKIFE